MNILDRLWLLFLIVVLFIFLGVHISKTYECYQNGQEAVRTYTSMLPVCMDRK